MKAEKPLLFIGACSKAQQKVDDVVQALKDVAECSPWNQVPEFSERGSSATFATLCEIANTFDFALFLFTPDDLVTSDDKEYAAPRDNVVWEHGLFLSILGPQRVQAIVQNSTPPVKLPSDFLGVNTPKFDYLEGERSRCRTQIYTVTRGFSQCISENSFRKIDLSLAQTWKYDSAARAFEVVLSAGRLTRARSVVGKSRVTIAARIENAHTNFEDDGNVIYAPLRVLNHEINEDVPFRLLEADFSQEIDRGHKIQARVVLVPPNVNLEPKPTLREAITMRCKDVDSMSFRRGESDEKAS